MKSYLTKPGFEFVFALSLIAIMALPPLVFAQGTKDMEIRIINGDTTINGKNIKSLSADERSQALNDIDHLGTINRPGDVAKRHMFMRKRAMADTGSGRIIVEDRHFRNRGEMPGFENDSAGRKFRFRMKIMNDKDSTFVNNYRFNHDRDRRFEDRERSFDFPGRDREIGFHHRRDVQSFEYNNTGTDGMNTHVSFRVSDASPEKLKMISGSEKADLQIKDLNLVPEFSSGKTLLMFGLPAKSAAEVRLTDHEGKLIWSDKALNGSFNKSFALGLNGIYFLQVKQAGKTTLKRIVKEE